LDISQNQTKLDDTHRLLRKSTIGVIPLSTPPGSAESSASSEVEAERHPTTERRRERNVL